MNLRHYFFCNKNLSNTISQNTNIISLRIGLEGPESIPQTASDLLNDPNQPYKHPEPECERRDSIGY